jgi:hypothetical protein
MPRGESTSPLGTGIQFAAFGQSVVKYKRTWFPESIPGFLGMWSSADPHDALGGTKSMDHGLQLELDPT